MRREDTVSLLVFRAGSQRPKAVPLSLVTRLEEIDCRRIEISDGRHLVQYRDQLMPLLRIDAETGLKKEGAQPILVFSDQRPLDGARGRRDRRHRRGQARHRSREQPSGRARLCRGQGHTPPRSSTSAISCRRLSRTGSAAATLPAERPRARCCWSTTRAFFRDMLAPLIKAAGYQVVAVGVGRRGARGAEIRHAVRSRRHRYRDAGHGRLRARRGGARHAGHRATPDHRARRHGFAPRRSSAAAPSASTILSPSSIAPA